MGAVASAAVTNDLALGCGTGQLSAALHGHSAGCTDLAFTPDSRSLLSGSEDGTLRVWDVASGQCVRVMQGYAASLFDIDWSPDGTQLVSGGTDALVTIWDGDGWDAAQGVAWT